MAPGCDPSAPEIRKTRGSFSFSPDRKYIDFVMGWCVGNSGWGTEEIMKNLRKFDGPTYVHPHHVYKKWGELAELLAKMTPGKLQKSFRATGGTEAVETALQAARVHTGREKFVSLEGSYHGHSFGTMSVGYSGFRRPFGRMLPGCCKIRPPFNADAGRRVEKLLKKEDVAAFISEPVVCNLGVVEPEKEFFGIVKDACKTYGSLLIMDEVATGFGRTGKLFASEHYKLKPDIMTLAKGITCGYGSLGACVTAKSVADSMDFPMSSYSTFGWLPLSVEGAIANIQYIVKNRLWENAARMEKHFRGRLEKINFKQEPDIRAKGLAICLEFDEPGYPVSVVKKCMRSGLLVHSAADPTQIHMFPALDIDKKTADAGLDILEKCI